MNNYKELKVWQKSVDLSTKVYEITSGFPSSEIYGLTSQIRRSAISIPSNIAEGSGRGSNKEFLHFLSIGLGSAFELETQMIIAEKLNMLKKEDSEVILAEVNEIEKMIRGLQKSINQ
jgi:four helix bundle protein